MILKIKININSWVYYDDIKKLHSYIPDDYCLTQIQESKEHLKHLEICGLTKASTKDGEREVVESSIMLINEFVLEQKEILDQAMFDGDKRKYWRVKIFNITDRNDNIKNIACNTWNDDIYLLNDDGKTIERL